MILPSVFPCSKTVFCNSRIYYWFVTSLMCYLMYKNLVSRCLWSNSSEKARPIFMNFFGVYLVGMRIGRKVYFIPLGDYSVPMQIFKIFLTKIYFCILFRFGIKNTYDPKCSPSYTPPPFLITILVFLCIY